jgi:hypothetical protein
VLTFEGLERIATTEAGPGDIVLITGIEGIGIGATICTDIDARALPMLKVDEPTLTMNFWSTPRRSRAAKASSSPAARSRPPAARTAEQRGAARRGDRRGRTSSRSRAAANCT